MNQNEYQRMYNRVPFFETCVVLRDGATGSYRTVDLGAGGFAIESDTPFPEGEPVTAVFGDAIEEQGVVAYCQPLESGLFQVGINFLKVRQGA